MSKTEMYFTSAFSCASVQFMSVINPERTHRGIVSQANSGCIFKVCYIQIICLFKHIAAIKKCNNAESFSDVCSQFKIAHYKGISASRCSISAFGPEGVLLVTSYCSTSAKKESLDERQCPCFAKPLCYTPLNETARTNLLLKL